MDIVIRRADPVTDSQDISNLIEICRSERRTILNSYSPQAEEAYIKNLSDSEAVFVATVDGSFAGFAGVSRRWPYIDRSSHCAEFGTWMMPMYRGRGVGKALWMRGVFPWCRGKGYTHLGSTVMAHNTGSIGFYESLGFHVCGYHRKTVDWDEDFLDSVEIEMILTSG